MNEAREDEDVDQDGSLFGDDGDSADGDFSEGEQKALNAAFSDDDEDGDDAMDDFVDAKSDDEEDDDDDDDDDDMDFDDWAFHLLTSLFFVAELFIRAEL